MTKTIVGDVIAPSRPEMSNWRGHPRLSTLCRTHPASPAQWPHLPSTASRLARTLFISGSYCDYLSQTPGGYGSGWILKPLSAAPQCAHCSELICIGRGRRATTPTPTRPRTSSGGAWHGAGFAGVAFSGSASTVYQAGQYKQLQQRSGVALKP